MSNLACPRCGHEKPLSIAYGNPDDAMIAAIESGALLHGGCAIAGLMPAYYCVLCDVRYDVRCSDEFMRQLKRLHYHQGESTISIHFTSDTISIVSPAISFTTPYTDTLKEKLALTQIEYWEHSEPIVWSLTCELEGYPQERFSVQGNATQPRSFALFQAWLSDVGVDTTNLST
jgi:hypothetical protein